MSRFARSNRHEPSSQIRCRTSPRTHPLSFALAAALASSAVVAVTTKASAPALHAQSIGSAIATSGASQRPDVQTTWTVQNCDDSGANSLRDVIENPLNAQSGDVVDLSQLPMLCGMSDSVITLTSEITVTQDNLNLHGPAPGKGTVTLSGASTSRVLHHGGNGQLYLELLRVVDGSAHASGDVAGGCIESESGNVFLKRVVIDHCTATSDSGNASGGGVSAQGVALIGSTISGNEAAAPGQGTRAYGGGIYSSGGMVAKYSAIRENSATQPGLGSFGGGAYVTGGSVTIGWTTVSANTAGDAGGLRLTPATQAVAILNSTISSNVAQADHSALVIIGTPMHVYNTTIAFNYEHILGTHSGAIYVACPSGSPLTLQSSIVANNTADSLQTPSDLYLESSCTITGADNVLIASNIVSPPAGLIAVASDPQLAPLQLNGGRIMTHQLLPGSPAIGKGNATGLLPPFDAYDQRGLGYPRTTGPSASVDIGAVQFDSIFVDGFDFQ